MKCLATNLLLCVTLVVGLSTASAEVTLDTVPVGDAGNVADFANSSRGNVNYAYNIGKFEVTIGQYTSFLNAVAANDVHGLYNPSMANTFPTIGIARNGISGSYAYNAIGNDNVPVFFVSWADAARFCNWMQNGQPTGPQSNATTEAGAYQFVNGQPPLVRSSDATWVIPTEDEWYKAAYYKGGNTNAGYWRYPMQSSTGTSNVFSSTESNNANYYFNGNYSDPVNFLTIVGAFASSPSPYGTFDQGGNVYEWTESGIPATDYHAVRGGSFLEGSNSLLSSSQRGFSPLYESNDLGFRVTYLVPEPGGLVLCASALLSFLRCRNSWRTARRE
jgi:formylglycine-generating enzyme